MEKLQIIESLVNAMYSQDCPNPQAITVKLLEWRENDSIYNVINYSIEFLTTKTNEPLLFFAAQCLRYCVHDKWNMISSDIKDKLLSFLCDYIIRHQDRRQFSSYTFVLICFADIVVLFKDFPIQQVFSRFPIDIQVEIFTYYFEEWVSKFYAQLTEYAYYPIPEYILEYVHNILQNTPLSEQWIKLYHNFALGLQDFKPLMIYMPILCEAAKIIPFSKMLMEHIKKVFIFDMHHGPDEYHFAIANLSILLSSNLRMAIQQNPSDFSLAETLNLLWDSVLNLEDSNEYFLKPEYLQITLNLIKEFINSEEVLIESVKLSHDLELWPNLLIQAMQFCENFTPECPIANFAINVLEFILTALDFGVNLSDITEKLQNFYKASFQLFNNYFINPSRTSPSLLLIIGYLNSMIPKQIIEMYCNNLQSFNAPPLIQIYFAKQIVDSDQEMKFEKFIPIFIDVFSKFFSMFPFKCSNGFYFLIQRYPHYIDVNLIQQLSGFMDKVPFYQQEFLISSIILFIPRISNEQAAPVYSNIFQNMIRAFMEMMQSQNKQNLITFFDQLHKIIQNIKNIQFANDAAYKLFISFSQQVFTVISNSLQDIWMDPSQEIQYKLSDFVYNFLQMKSIQNPALIAQWINQIISVSPIPYHISLVLYLINYIQLMPNIPIFIKRLESSKNLIPEWHDFVNSVLNLIQNLIPEWNDTYWNIVPPDIIFNGIYDKALQNNAYNALILFVENPKISAEFKNFILQKVVQGMSIDSKPLVKQVELFVGLKEVLGVAVVVSTISQKIPMEATQQQTFVNLLSSSISYEDLVKSVTDFLSHFIEAYNINNC